MNPERQEPSVQSFAGDSWELHINASEADAAGQVVSKRLMDLGWDESEANDFALAFAEQLINAINHGNGGDVKKNVGVELRLGADEAEVSISNEGGVIVDPEKVLDPTTPEGLMKTGGRGLFIAKELCDEVRYDAGKVTMIKRRTRTGA